MNIAGARGSLLVLAEAMTDALERDPIEATRRFGAFEVFSQAASFASGLDEGLPAYLTSDIGKGRDVVHVGPGGVMVGIYGHSCGSAASTIDRILRASDVEFSEAHGGWRIKFKEWVGLEDPDITFPPHHRDTALAYEVRMLRSVDDLGERFILASTLDGTETAHRPGLNPGTSRI